jgi:hypothetical protein
MTHSKSAGRGPLGEGPSAAGAGDPGGSGADPIGDALRGNLWAQLAAIDTPFLQRALHTTALDGSDWMRIALVGAPVFVVPESLHLLRAWRRVRGRARGRHAGRGVTAPRQPAAGRYAELRKPPLGRGRQTYGLFVRDASRTSNAP